MQGDFRLDVELHKGPAKIAVVPLVHAFCLSRRLCDCFQMAGSSEISLYRSEALHVLYMYVAGM